MQKQRPLEFKDPKKGKFSHPMPAMISYEMKTSETPVQRLWPISILSPHVHNVPILVSNPTVGLDINKIPSRYLNRVPNIDQQVCKLNRIANQCHSGLTQKGNSSLPQSQSFNQNIYKSYGNPNMRSPSVTETSHMSRLITSNYMSPPPSDWITVGNIIPVKRSTSMPGYHAANSNFIKPIHQNVNEHSTSTKKKSGPFQCLKHSIKKSSIRNESTSCSMVDSVCLHFTKSPTTPPISTQIPVIMSSSVQFSKQNAEKSKISKSIFKKKLLSSGNAPQPTSSKTRGIKKSISLFFSSKSHRSVKSDPNTLDRYVNTHQAGPISPIIMPNERQFSFKSSARLNHSYESMLYGDDKMCSLSLYTDTNRSNSYISGEEDNSSLDYSNSVDLVEKSDRVRTPSEFSVPDTASLSSSRHLFSGNQSSVDQHSITATSCHGNINYKAPTDTGWKTVVGNVCRSNSKDSAIAISTLSADPMPIQSKRMSQISTVSRTSDITQTSEDFNDSSYSSFNDLQINSSQIYHKRKRIKSILPRLTPIEIESKQLEPACSYDNSPFSDSSTETLRPLSCLIRQRFASSGKNIKPFHSNTIIKTSMFSNSKDNLKCNSLRHSHSWPSCIFSSLCKSVSSHMTCLKQSRQKPTHTTAPIAMKLEHLKLDRLNYNRINNSPLLSQYSRLYSLKSVGTQQKNDLANFSGHQTSSIQPPLSPINYSYRTQQHFPS